MLRTGEQTLCLAQLFGSLPGRLRIGLRAAAALHCVGGLLQAPQCLLDALFVLILAVLANRLPATLTYSGTTISAANLIAPTTIRSTEPDPCLPLLLVPRHLLHLALQLFSFAAQHFLLPTLLKALLRIALVGQLLLPLGKRIQLRQRVLDLLLVLLGGRRVLRSLVLILFRIQFEIEEAGQVASRIAAARPPPPPLWPKATWILRKVASARSSACSAFCSSGSASFHCVAFSLSAEGAMAVAAACMSLSKSVNSWLAADISRLCMRADSAITWSRSFCCASERNCPCDCRILRRRGLVVLLLPCGRDQFFFALGDFSLIVAAPPPPPPTAAALLRLRELALERIHLDEADICAGFTVAVARSGINAHQIARHELEIFKGEGVCPSAFFAPGFSAGSRSDLARH